MTSDWHTFFKPYFTTGNECAAFVDECESINRDYRPPEQLDDSTPKVIMHQTVRLVTLSDLVHAFPRSHDPLALFFLLVCAECVAKLHAGFDQEGQSRAFVQRFFAEHVSAADKQILTDHFQCSRSDTTELDAVVDLLYDVRCDVVHEGRYWGFSFPTDACPVLNLHPHHDKGQAPISVSLPLSELRGIIVRGCIAAVMNKLQDRQQHAGEVSSEAAPSASPDEPSA